MIAARQEIDALAHKVILNGDPVRLRLKDYNLLHVQVRFAGRVVTTADTNSVRVPAHIGDTQYLRDFIGQLCAKIEPDPANPQPHIDRTRHWLSVR